MRIALSAARQQKRWPLGNPTMSQDQQKPGQEKNIGPNESALLVQEWKKESDKKDALPTSSEGTLPNIPSLDRVLIRNPLIHQINGILEYVDAYKEKVRDFYFRVLLSQHACPTCGDALHMTGVSECSCRSGHIFDPTVAFQPSPCCQARLIRKTFHYACSRCHKTVPSRFLFDERVFDAEYFREMMREHRDHGKKPAGRDRKASGRIKIRGAASHGRTSVGCSSRFSPGPGCVHSWQSNSAMW